MSIPTPEYHSIEEFINRSAKLEEIRKMGMEPYPHKFEPNITAEELSKRYSDKELGHSEDAAEGKTESFKMAGRLVLFRAMGKNAFAQLQDHTGRMQLMFNRDLTSVEGYNPDGEGSKPIKFIEKKLDLGDIIGIEGNLFRTQKGEITIFVKHLTLLCKSLCLFPTSIAALPTRASATASATST